jgi:hypothetical protein
MVQIEGYQTEKLTIDLVWANVFGILILIPGILLFGLPFYLVWKDDLSIPNFKNLTEHFSLLNIGGGAFFIFIVLILGAIIHELIHGLTWACYTKRGFRSIKFGVLWTMLTPYCHCKEPLRVRHYILGAVTPAIFLGLVPGIISIIIGNLGLLLFGIFFTMAAGGDFLIVNLLRKEKMDHLVQDHPSEAGCFIYRKID